MTALKSGYHIDKPALFELLGYSPMEHQWKFHNCKTRFRCAVCGRRTGKTTMVAHDRIASLLVPKTLGWIVGPTYDLASKEFRIMWDSLIVGLNFGNEKKVKKNFNIRQGDMYIEMPWGARVEVRSAALPHTLVGDGLDWVIMSEAAKQNEETWQKYIRPALSDHRGTADFVTTPEGKNWLYKLWLLYKTRPQENASFRFPSWVNNKVYPGGYDDPEIQAMLETTLEEWFLQEIAAEFTAVVGRIFGEFNETDHVLDHAYEFNPDWPNYMCVDDETEIFTSSGWKSRSELSIGDSVLSINPETGLSEWDEVLTINEYEGEHDVIRMEGRSHSSVTTPNHKWLTNRSYVHGKGGKLGWRWTTTNKLAQDDRVPTAAPCVTLPTQPKYEDALVELIAWLWTEGSVSKGSFAIHQSHKVNPAYVSRIRAALTKLWPNSQGDDISIALPGQWVEKVNKSNPNITTFYLTSSLSNQLWPYFIKHKVVDPNFITQLTESQLNLFIDVSIMADGHETKTGRRTINQKSSDQLEAIQMACTLLGMTTRISPTNGYTLNINQNQFINPAMAAKHGSKFKIVNEKYNGTVWCPMTSNGTWLARRKGTVYYTGNSFDWGFTAPLAAIEFQVSPRDEIFVWREHYQTNRTLEWHINTIKERINPEGYRLDGAFGDAADPEAVAYVSQHLVYCQADPDSKQWMPGIRLIKSALKLEHDGISFDEHERPIEKPRYHVDPSCVEHISEMTGYRARQGIKANEFTGAGVVDKGVPDHTIDAMRYAFMHLWSVGVQHHLDEVYPEWAINEREKLHVRYDERIPDLGQSPHRELETVGSANTFFKFNLDNPSRGGRF